MPTLTDAVRTCSQDADRQSGEEAVLTWKVHRIREDPRGAYLVGGAYAAAFLLWRIVYPQPLALAIPLFAMTGALSDFLFPITYRLTTRGAYSDCGATRLFLPWTAVKRATFGQDGVYLSPFPVSTRLDSFRGVRLRFSEGNDDSVLSEVRRLWRGSSEASA